ncbi:unnamed protein product [Prunus armeniaca]
MDAISKLPDVSKIDTFNGAFFKRWQERVFSTLDVLNLSTYLTKLKPMEGTDNYNKALAQWEKEEETMRKMKKFRSSGGQKGREERAMKEKRVSSSHSATPTKKREGLEGKKANSLSISRSRELTIS